MDREMTENINERINNIHKFSQHGSSDRLAMEMIVNNSYHIMKSVLTYFESLPGNEKVSGQEFVGCVDILRHVYNLSCCTLHIGYSHGDPLVFNSYMNQIKCIDGLVNKGEEIPDEVLNVYNRTIDKKAVSTLDGQTKFIETMLNDIERNFRSSKCLIYDGSLSDINDKGWTDIVEYIKESREEDGKIFSLDNFENEIIKCQAQIAEQTGQEK